MIKSLESHSTDFGNQFNSIKNQKKIIDLIELKIKQLNPLIKSLESHSTDFGNQFNSIKNQKKIIDLIELKIKQ